MKNMKKIISLALIFTLIVISSISAFALSDGTKYGIKLVASSDEVAVGETVTIGMYIYCTDGTDVSVPESSGNSAQFSFDTTGFSVADNGLVATNSVGTVALVGSSNVGYQLQSKAATFSEDVAFATATFVAETVGTYSFELEGVEGTCSFGGLDFYFADEEGGTEDYGLVEDAITVTVTAGSTEPEYPYVENDEVFTDGTYAGITTTAATKAVSVFGKAPEGGLKAGKYGAKVVSDGKTFKFAGIKDVEEGKVWVVKIISPDGTFTFSDETTVMATNAVSAYVD